MRYEAKEKDDKKEEVTRRDFLKILGFGLISAGDILKSEEGLGEEKKESPFNPEVQKETLRKVAEHMKIDLRAEIELPLIIAAESVPDEQFDKVLGFNSDSKRMNIFLPPNTIFLVSDSKIHNLAHELVHYIQYNYLEVKDGTGDAVEDDAVKIQNYFRN